MGLYINVLISSYLTAFDCPVLNHFGIYHAADLLAPSLYLKVENKLPHSPSLSRFFLSS